MKKDWSEYIGQKFNKLTILKLVPRINSNLARYLCKCDCGNEIEVNYSSLKHNKVGSCGCLIALINKGKNRPNKSKGFGVRSFNAVYLSYRCSAKKRGFDFKLTKEEFKEITSLNCVYCGKEPSMFIGNTIKYGCYFYNGIDRIDNEIGYIKSNCSPCCKTCNYMKKELSLEEFKDHISKVFFYSINKC